MEATAPSTSETSSEPPKAVKKHPVIEIFGPVIQGEGSQAGNQTMFIRFGGCDYRCAKCDSLHAVIPGAIQKYGKMMDAEEIAYQIFRTAEETGVRWVTFSGGNPAMHKLDALVSLLKENGFYINVETQGTLFQEWMYECDVITVSPKSPGMGEKCDEAVYRKFLKKVNGVRPLCVKVVVFSEQDLEFALFINQITKQEADLWLYGGIPVVSFYLSLGNPFPPELDDEYNIQPAPHPDGNGGDIGGMSLTLRLLKSYQRLSEEVLQDPRLKDYRFLPQLHVLVYGNETGR